MNQYRGRTKDGKEVVGWYIETGKMSYICNRDIIPAEIFYFTKPNGEHINAVSGLFSGFVEVTPESVGMDTGLKDKNKKPIFGSLEGTRGGHIVILRRYMSSPHNSDERTLEMQWSDFHWGWVLYDKEYKQYYDSFRMPSSGEYELEIIGNAWDF